MTLTELREEYDEWQEEMDVNLTFFEFARYKREQEKLIWIFIQAMERLKPEQQQENPPSVVVDLGLMSLKDYERLVEIERKLGLAT